MKSAGASRNVKSIWIFWSLLTTSTVLIRSVPNLAKISAISFSA